MTLEYTLTKSADVVFDYLTDVAKFVLVHPIIYKMDLIGPNRYRIHETLPIGFIPYSFTYTATIDSDWLTKTVIIHATVLRINRIRMVFDIRANGDCSTVREDVTVETPLPIRWLMQAIFKKQHAQLFANIDRAEVYPKTEQ